MCPISLGLWRRRRLARTFHAAHIFLQAEHERGPPLRRRFARIYVIAAGRRRLCCRAHPSSAVNLTRLCDYGRTTTSYSDSNF
jgi:hypothetical protein